jgi:excisionase family DNA binding protein
MGAPRHTNPFLPPPPTTDEDLLDTEAAARRIGVRPETLRKMAQRGEIASVKYGKLRRFEPAQLRAFIAGHRKGVA